MRAIIRGTVLLAAALLLAPVAGRAATYEIDAVHSTVGFRIRHLVGRVNGQFTKFAGTIVFDAAQPTRARVNATIEAASINTANERRDDHLRGADFFDVEKYPTLTFVSRKVTPKGKGRFQIQGDLTMRGVKRPVVMNAVYNGSGQDQQGRRRIGFTATTRLNRKDYAISWNQTLDRGGAVLGDEVEITLEIEAVEQR
ncbi:MAG: YceI family protein [Armatimonadetes bacterium]|jgi:polyisoprenoid-binding protein YceI|nr:YceI family protein [Armatimonadota bacterium]